MAYTASMTIEDKERMLYIRCDCGSPEHHFILTDFPDINGEYDTGPFLEVHLRTYLPWYKRVWPAIKYIFGHKSKYGNFDNTTIDVKHIPEIIDFLQEALENRKANNGK